ncbi:MAG TPA: nicotinamidase [Syntrophus sp. (in: bacteria)]|jgi:nicotinamidase/pyrazinamidase|nr:nicotinamidase [Syntrophus sp. (in: bacteria)]
MDKGALVVIDMLNDFILPGSPLEVPDARRAVPAVRREIERARAAGRPVIYLCDSHDPDDAEFGRFGWPPHAVAGTRGAEVVEPLRPEARDTIIAKRTYSGFHQTELDAALRGLGISRLRLAGCVSHICVLFTAADAVLRGYEVTVVRDAVAGLDPVEHAAALRIMQRALGAQIEGGIPALPRMGIAS